MKHRILLGSLAVIVLAIVLGWRFVNMRAAVSSLEKSDHTTNSSLVGTSNPAPAPSPQPFSELTIPYLQVYRPNSRLGAVTPVATQSAYTSYVTNYTSDGLKINGLLTIPSGEMPASGWPAIIFIHGYVPPAQYQTLTRYVEYVDYLASAGFVVFKIDLRGHGQSEGQARGTYYSSGYIKDVLNAHTALQQFESVDAAKIGVWGHSMGGNIVARALAARPEMKVGVIWAGAVYTYQDFGEYSIQDNSYVRQDINYNMQQERERLFALYGPFSISSDFWRQVTPIEYLKKYPVQIQINHAVDDRVVSVEYGRNLVEKLKGSQAQVELWEYPSGGHNISGPSFSVAMARTVDFFKKHFEVK